MANQRKYFNYGIEQLEEIFARSYGDIGVIEELEEELAHRNTKRAKKLLAKVQAALNTNAEKTPSSETEFCATDTSQSSISPPVSSKPYM